MNLRALGVGAGVLGIAALLLGLPSKQWVVGKEFFETHVGLRGMELCQEVRPEPSGPGRAACSTVSHGDYARSALKPDGFETFSMVSHITFYSGLVAVGMLLIVILLALVGRYPKGGIAPSTISILLSFATLLLIVITQSIHPWKEIGWGTGYSIFLAAGGTAGCLLSSILLGRLRPPVQDSW